MKLSQMDQISVLGKSSVFFDGICSAAEGLRDKSGKLGAPFIKVLIGKEMPDQVRHDR